MQDTPGEARTNSYVAFSYELLHTEVGTQDSPEDFLGAMNDRKEWRERVREIHASSTIWWWWWWFYIFISTYRFSCFFTPVCLDCGILRLHFCREVWLRATSVLDMTIKYLMVKFLCSEKYAQGNIEYLFIDITPWFTLIQSISSTW